MNGLSKRSNISKELEKNTHKIRWAMKGTYIEGFLYALMVGSAESFALFFAVKRGVSLSELALLSTLPLLLGSLSQFLIPLFSHSKRLKQITLICFGLQVVGLLIVAISTWTTSIFLAIFFGMCLYWIGGMAAGPLWLEWISQQMPQKIFRRYLSKRNAFVSLSILVAYLSVAAYLQSTGESKNFFYVFCFGGLVRFISIFIQANISTPFKVRHRESMKMDSAVNLKGLLIYLIGFTALFKFGVSVASPFFLPYMVNKLHFSLAEYTLLTAIPFLGRFITLSGWGRASTDIKPLMGLQISTLGICVLPTLWIFIEGFPLAAYMLLELASGILWGGFELCTILIIQRLWHGHVFRAQAIHLSLMNLFSLLGALLGSALIENSNYNFSFHMSSVLRFAFALAMIVLFRKFRIKNFNLKDYGVYLITVLALRPSYANVGRILFIARRGRR